MNYLLEHKDRINHFLFILIFATLIFSNNLNSILLIVFCIFNFSLTNKNQWKELLHDKMVLSMIFFFVVYIASYFFSHNDIYAEKVILRNAAYLMLPAAVFFSIPNNNISHISRLLRVWILILTAGLLLALVMAFYKNVLFNLQEGFPFYRLKSWYFTYHYIANNLNISAIYLSIYVGLAIMALALDISKSMSPKIELSKRLKILLLIFLLMFLFLLSARTVLFLTLIALFFIFFKASIKTRKQNLFFMTTAVFTTILGIIIYNNDVLRIRLLNAFKLHEESKYFSGGLSSRIYQWKALLNQFMEENIILGVGIGDIKEFYSAAYREAGLDWAIKHGFNAHNMYLEILFGIGVVGLLVLIFIFLTSIYKAISSRNAVYLAFILLFMGAGLTESLLSRHNGIIYLVLFNSLFYFNLKLKNK